MSKQLSHQTDEWSLPRSEAEPSERIHKIGGWLVFLVWAAGMLSIYFLLLHAGYVKPYNEPLAVPAATVPAKVQEAPESLANATVQPRMNSDVLVFQSSQSFISHFSDRYSLDELQAELANALTRQRQSSFRTIRVSANGPVKGAAFAQDYTVAVR